MNKKRSTLAWMITNSIRLLILVGVCLVIIAAGIGISGFTHSSILAQPANLVYLPTIHNTDTPGALPSNSPHIVQNLKVFASASSQAKTALPSPGWSAAPTSLPGLRNENLLTPKQIADIIAYLLNIGHRN